MINEYGVHELLRAVSHDLENREKVIEERSDRNLAGAVEMMFPILVESQPKVGKRLGGFIKMVLNSNPVKEALVIIKASSKNHSIAVKEAYRGWLKLQPPDVPLDK